MIRFDIKWMISQAKVNLRSLSFYLLALLLGLGFWLTGLVLKEYNKDMNVVVYSKDSNLGDFVSKYFEASEYNGISFGLVDNLDELKQLVSTGDASCGIYFSDKADLLDKKSVVVYQTLGTIDGYVIKEILYPVMNRGQAYENLDTYLSGFEWSNSSDREYVLNQYQNYLDNLEVTILNVNSLGEIQESNDDLDLATRSKRLFVYFVIVILVMGITLYDISHTDNAFYKSFPKQRRVLLYIEKVLVTTVMISAFGAVFFNFFSIAFK